VAEGVRSGLSTLIGRCLAVVRQGFTHQAKELPSVHQESTSAKRPGQCCNSAQDGASVHSEGQGGEPSNTPPNTRQSPKESQGNRHSATPGRVVPGGFDWLKVSCYGDWDVRRWQGLIASLEAAKLKSQQAGQVGTLDGPDGGYLVVKPGGVRKGMMGGCWVVAYEGITFIVADRPDAHATIPNVVVDIPSLVLMRLGHWEAWRLARRVLAGLGFELHRTSVSRADLALDLVLPTRSFVSLAAAGKWVKRAREGKSYWKGELLNIATLELGTDPIMLRIYDKRLEMMRNGVEEEKVELMLERWGGDVPHATRIEFEVKREFLRGRNINTVEELFAAAADLAAYLCDEWIRFTLDVPDRENRNQGRAAVHPLWVKVQEGFAEVFGQSENDLPPREWKAPAVKALKASLYGLLSSIAAKTGQTISTCAEFEGYCLGLLREGEEAFFDRLTYKLMKWQAKGPGRGLAWADDIPY
jgi:hypothetical protein